MKTLPDASLSGPSYQGLAMKVDSSATRQPFWLTLGPDWLYGLTLAITRRQLWRSRRTRSKTAPKVDGEVKMLVIKDVGALLTLGSSPRAASCSPRVGGAETRSLACSSTCAT